MLLDLVYLILRGEILNVALFSLATSDKLCNNIGQVQYVLRISALRRKLRGLNFVNQCLHGSGFVGRLLFTASLIAIPFALRPCK